MRTKDAENGKDIGSKRLVQFLIVLNVIVILLNVFYFFIGISDEDEEEGSFSYYGRIEIVGSDDQWELIDSSLGPETVIVWGINIEVKSLLDERTDVIFESLIHFGDLYPDKENATLISVGPRSFQEIDLEICRIKRSELDWEEHPIEGYIRINVMLDGRIIEMWNHDMNYYQP